MRTSASFISAFNCLSTNCSGDCSSKNLPLPVPVRLGLLRLSPDELRVRVRRGRLFGWVTEWLIVHAWKACVPKGTGGSNPPPSAMSEDGRQQLNSNNSTISPELNHTMIDAKF